MNTIVSTEKSSVLVILRREYLDITDNFCAAKLIEYFKHWTKWKIKNHRTPWVYQPLKRIYADLMGEHSLHVIRSAIALLEEIGILEKQKNPGNGQDRTWQYKLHFNVLNRLLEHRKCKTEPSRFNAEQHLRSDPKTTKPQQHAAVGEVESGEVDWEVVAKQTEYWEQTQICKCVEEEPPHSAPITQEPEQVQISRYVDEFEQIDSTGETDTQEDQYSEPQVEVGSNTNKPSKQEISEICNELRRLRINPEPCLGVVKKYWGNVQGAIARVKEAVQQGWCDNPSGLFVASCKNGEKPKNSVNADVSQWFNWARKQR